MSDPAPMKTQLITALAFSLSLIAPHSTFGAPANVFGFGHYSCARWLAEPEVKAVGSNWVLGLWSGMNLKAADGTTGHSTDWQGIVGEVEKVCRREPSLTLIAATMQAYDVLKAKGR